MEFKDSMRKGIILKVGKTGAEDTMAVELENTACFVQDTFDFNYNEGERTEKRCESGDVIISNVSNGDLIITGELNGLEDSSKFWEMDGDKVVSLVTDDFMSVEIAPELDGATGIKAPKCGISAGVAYQTANGWRIPIEIRIFKTKGDKGYFFQFFTVGSEA